MAEVRRCCERFEAEPNVFSAYAYDAFRLVRQAVLEGALTRAEVRDRLPSVRIEAAGPSRGLDAQRTPERASRLHTLVGQAFAPVPEPASSSAQSVLDVP